MRLLGHVAHALLVGDQVALDGLAVEQDLAAEVISIRPVIIFMVVDLPEPFGPR